MCELNVLHDECQHLECTLFTIVFFFFIIVGNVTLSKLKFSLVFIGLLSNDLPFSLRIFINRLTSEAEMGPKKTVASRKVSISKLWSMLPIRCIRRHEW